MFNKAKIKLTIWYVVIISVISLLFSVAIYRTITVSAKRALQIQQDRMERRRLPGSLPMMQGANFIPPIFEEETFIDIQKDLKNALIRINVVVILGAAALGYFMSGITLKPIETAMEDQKRFISDAAHELKTPLTALKTELEVTLRDTKLDLKESKLILNSNLEEVNKLQNLTETLLKESYYQKYNSAIKKEQVNLKQIVVESIEEFEKQAKRQHLKFASELDDINVHGNTASISEVVNILLDNAIKYSKPETKVRVSLSQQGNTAKLEISDEGVGIRKTDIPHIFSRFYKADNSRSKNISNGFGLGLSIAKNIVEMHKGKISVSSELDKGSTFTVLLPLSK